MTGRSKDDAKLKGFQDLLALSDADRRALIASAKTDTPDTEPRRHARLLMDANTRIAIQLDGPSGPGAGYIVYPVDISESGISFIHCAFLHDNTRCKLHLRALDGKIISAAARITRARYLKGKAHEVAAEFDEPLAPSLFVAPDNAQETPRPSTSAEPKDADIRALFSSVLDELQTIVLGLQVLDDVSERLRGVISSAQSALESR